MSQNICLKVQPESKNRVINFKFLNINTFLYTKVMKIAKNSSSTKDKARVFRDFNKIYLDYM